MPQFVNVTIYRNGVFGIDRKDCKEVEVTEGVEYAQYKNATKIVYLEKGKRTRKQFYIASNLDRVLIIPQARAVPARDIFTPAMTEGGVVTKSTRHASCSPEYWSELIEDLSAAGVNDYAFAKNHEVEVEK